MEKQNYVKPSDIDATLTDGQMFVGEGWFAVIIFLAVAIGIDIVIYAVLLFFPPYDEAFIIMMPIGFLILLVPVSIITGLYVSGKKGLKLWLGDAVILTAKSKKIGSDTARYRAVSIDTSAIQVFFKFNNERFTRRSERKGKLRCQLVYNKYVDQMITIAYSPKYDKVMLIKPECAKHIDKEIDNNG